MAKQSAFPESQPAGIKPASLMRRVSTALVYGLAVLGALWWGVRPTGVLFGAMAGFAAAEFYAMERRERRLPNEPFGIIAATAMPIAAAFWGLPGLSAVVTALIAASLLWHTLFVHVQTADTAETVFGAVYTGFLLAYLVLIRTFEQGLLLSVVLVVSVWVNDMAAYFVGSLAGRHKMVPHISPKKSWEGFVAGALACTLVWLAAPLLPGLDLSRWLALAAGVAVALSSVVGDLAESRMKREAGVKDSGSSLPGHGGFLDRLDSLILVCLVAYWVLWWGGVR
ncbi:MAG: phosphatidate cytidylyltransferase [Actinobacteria bacterium HGW-Actinobacteria-7]|jgi:phosphatidate cytidylyltransferase|nr:MAG: phosphatidate cytidylyltransferase [Actinobacteria bacterium HGW-Actinobacteria-7]